MHNVSVVRKIKKPVNEVWKKLDSFGKVSNYHPHVKHSETINEIATGSGAERTCHFEDGNRIKERIISYEAGSNYEVDIFDPGSFPLSKAVARLEVMPVNDESSEVVFSMSFEPKFGALGWVMAQLMMKKQFEKTLASVLEGLDTHLQTGQIITKQNYRLNVA